MADPDDVRFYEMIRSRIEHEDGLIVQRLSWLVGSQSFLFTAFAISVNGIASLGVPELLTPMPIRAPGLAAPLLLPLLFIAAWTWLLVRA